jgi:ubiquinone biosynthesis O-methyltransferase
LVRLFIRVHNISYTYIGRLSVIAGGGIHPKHRLTNYHSFFISNIKRGDTVLDIGCGNGYLTYVIAKKAKKVIAVDLNEKNIEQAKEKFMRDNIEYLHEDATRINFNEKFDIVTLSNVLEHIEDRHSFLLKICELADKFLIRVPMINRDWLTYYKKELGCEYFLDSTHKIEYTIDSFKEELSKVGLKINSSSIQFGEIWAVVVKSR